MDLIKIENVTKRFAKHVALDDVSLSIPEGSIYGLLGPNGAGKSTLLQIMGSLMAADGGEVVIDGVSLENLSDDELSEFRNKRIGFIFQSYHLLPEFSALENVMMPMLIAGVGRAEASKRALELS